MGNRYVPSCCCTEESSYVCGQYTYIDAVSCCIGSTPDQVTINFPPITCDRCDECCIEELGGGWGSMASILSAGLTVTCSKYTTCEFGGDNPGGKYAVYLSELIYDADVLSNILSNNTHSHFPVARISVSVDATCKVYNRFNHTYRYGEIGCAVRCSMGFAAIDLPGFQDDVNSVIWAEVMHSISQVLDDITIRCGTPVLYPDGRLYTLMGYNSGFMRWGLIPIGLSTIPTVENLGDPIPPTPPNGGFIDGLCNRYILSHDYFNYNDNNMWHMSPYPMPDIIIE